MTSHPPPFERPPLWQLSLVVTSNVLFGMAFSEYFFTTVSCLAVMASYFHQYTIEWPQWEKRTTLLWVFLGSLVGCSLYDLFVLPSQTPALEIIRGLMTIMGVVWVWHTPGKASRKGWAILLTTGLTVCSAASTYRELSRTINRSWFFALLILYGTEAIALLLACHESQFLRLSSRKEKVRQVTLIVSNLLVIGILTWVGSYYLNLLSQNIFKIFEAIDASGFSTPFDELGAFGDLGLRRNSTLTLNRDVLAIVTTPQPPGYLRAQVLTQYSEGRWKSEANQAAPLATIASPTNPPLHTYALPSDAGETDKNHTVDQETLILGDLHGVVPLPYRSLNLSTPDSVAVSLSPGPILVYQPPNGLNSYRVTVSTGEVSPQKTSLQSTSLLPALEISEELKKNLQPLAQRVIGNTSKNKEAAFLVQNYFRNNYQYSLNVRLAPQIDPIVDFVLNQKPAYCKYFASGMVLMLRSVGIPARMANGYYTQEYNPFGKQWVIRQQHAHAWCEVFEPETNQWLVFDPTPPSALEYNTEKGFWSYVMAFKDWVVLQFRSLWMELMQTEFSEWPLIIGKKFLHLIGMGHYIPVLVLSSILILFYRKRIFPLVSRFLGMFHVSLLASRKRKSHGTNVQHIFQLVAQTLETHGLPIKASETVLEFMQRTQISNVKGQEKNPQLAEFFQAYLQYRFHPVGSPGKRSVEDLDQKAQQAILALQKEPQREKQSRQ